MIDINLLPYERKFPKKLIWLIAVLAFVCVLAFTGLAVYSWKLDTELKSVQQEEAVWKARSLKKSAVKQPDVSVKPTPAAAVDFLTANRLSVFLTWTSINRQLPEGGTVVTISYSDTGSVTVQCHLEHFADIRPFADRLRKNSFSQVVTTEVKQPDSVVDGLSGYLVTLTLSTGIRLPINQ
ncbi:MULTISPECIES: PilN domain-containing protein [unclassified Sporolactobacillus]|uniref:PilN domain-containing protein n=1 Tax=unclassified Sporolactobacillus TaxID=2628533 RepID=UPI002367A3A6|nr:hypothetical protein [Sporolactobacillus sp. CQH2019]MDD9147659.1 hypothetical protein [Sporolactobacillus sp. CQH2019]